MAICATIGLQALICEIMDHPISCCMRLADYHVLDHRPEMGSRVGSYGPLRPSVIQHPFHIATLHHDIRRMVLY